MGKYKVLNRTVETTNAHVESDKSGLIEETWNDVSVSYDAYTKYDEVEVTTPDTSIDEDTKDQVRHTHLNTGEKLSEKILSMAQYYLDNNLYPTNFFFKGDESKKDSPIHNLSNQESDNDVVDTIMPVTAHEENGTPINISESDVVEPVKE